MNLNRKHYVNFLYKYLYFTLTFPFIVGLVNPLAFFSFYMFLASVTCFAAGIDEK